MRANIDKYRKVGGRGSIESHVLQFVHEIIKKASDSFIGQRWLTIYPVMINNAGTDD